MLKYKIAIAFCLLASATIAQSVHKYLLKGDEAYENGNYAEAEVNYRRALEKDNTIKGTYNLGNSTYRQERYDEAIRQYEAAAENAKDRSTKARAFHNLGNAHYQKGDFRESIEAYKNALRLNPGDLATKRNLANALRKLPPPQQQSQPSQGKDKKDPQDQKKDQDQSDSQPQQQDQPGKNEESENPDENQEQNEQQEQQQSSGAKERPQDLSKEEARQLLEIMDQEEQKVQQKLRKAQAKNRKSAKDW